MCIESALLAHYLGNGVPLELEEMEESKMGRGVEAGLVSQNCH